MKAFIRFKDFSHKCDLPQASTSCLPLLPPQASYSEKWFRTFKKLFLISDGHRLTKKYYRSNATKLFERKRHLQKSHWYIIHPFSSLSKYIEIFMTFNWFFMFMIDPVFDSFFENATHFELILRKNVRNYFIVIQSFFIITRFFSGYIISSTSEVILSHQMIMGHYLKTYFIFDLSGVIPFQRLATFIYHTKNYPSIVDFFCVLYSQIKMVRIFTALRYFRHITGKLGFSHVGHKIMCLTINGVYMLHWCSCLFYFIPSLDVKNSINWITEANIANDPIYRKYIISLYVSTTHFLSSGTTTYSIKYYRDYVVCSIITLLGYFFLAFSTAYVLQTRNSSAASECKYEELLQSLMIFCQRKKLPYELRERLILYYEYKFQKHYFKENVIMASLSEHLQYEVMLHSCRHLLESVKLLKGLSKVTIGTLIASLKHEVYLPNETVLQSTFPSNGLYFIASGTLGVFTNEGSEIFHIEDGDHFGATGILYPEFGAIINVIAIETSELYRLKRFDFFYIYDKHPEFAERIRKECNDILNKTYTTIDKLRREKNKTDILNDLKMGKILERNRTVRKGMF